MTNAADAATHATKNAAGEGDRRVSIGRV